MTKDLRARTFTKVLSGTGLILQEGSDPVLDPPCQYVVEQVNGQWGIYNIQTLDLTGYTLQEKTTFIQNVMMQDMSLGPGGNGTYMIRCTVVSTIPINFENLYETNVSGWHMPGSNQSEFNLQHIIMGRGQYFLPESTPNMEGLMLNKEWVWGAGDSTAASKIWLCDAYLISGTSEFSGVIPDNAFVMPVLIGDEAELEYMMRLARSVEPVN